MSWQKVKLGNVCTVLRNGASIKQIDSALGIPITRIETISDYHLNLHKLGYANIFEDTYKDYYLQKNDILMSHINSWEHLGKTAKVETLTNPIIHGMNLLLIRTISEILNATYLNYYFKSTLFRACIDKIANQSVNQASFAVTKLKEIEIPLPPLDVQKKIADILDKADALRRKDAELIKKYDELAQSIFIDMFGDPVTNPKGWEIKKFGDYIVTLTDYHANGSYEILKQHVVLKNTPDYALMVRTTDLENQNFNDNVNYISEDAYHFLSKSKVFGGDIIINKIGSAGNLYLMPELNKPVSLGMNAFLIRCNALVNQKFIFYLLKTPFGTKEIKSRVFGAVTKTITKDAVRDIPIYNIPLKLQNSYINSVEKVNNSINMLKKNNSEQLFQSLLQRAFNGELVH